jgi:hypothetical protein
MRRMPSELRAAYHAVSRAYRQIAVIKRFKRGASQKAACDCPELACLSAVLQKNSGTLFEKFLVSCSEQL